MNESSRTQVIMSLWPENMPRGSTVYAILDAARDERIYDSIMLSGLGWKCLYSGYIPEDLARVAPYLVRLDSEHPVTESLIDASWGNSWGIFLTSPAGMEELRKHFHSFLTVETEDGSRLVFRYYDPRVLRTYLPTCRSGELQTVFGPVRNFIMESADPLVLIDFHMSAGRLIAKQRLLLPADDGQDLTP